MGPYLGPDLLKGILSVGRCFVGGLQWLLQPAYEDSEVGASYVKGP